MNFPINCDHYGLSIKNGISPPDKWKGRPRLSICVNVMMVVSQVRDNYYVVVIGRMIIN
jgi:hypothetical protein